MILVLGSAFPDHLLYDVKNHVWRGRLENGAFRLGRSVEAGRACATVESGKWVGPARIALGDEALEVNEDLMRRPRRANADPYGAGWMLIARPDAGAEPVGLIGGNDLAEAYQAWMAAEDFPGFASI